MTRRGANVSTEVKDKSKEMSLKRDDLHPGDCVSIDQYESRVRGRLSTSRGNEQAHTQYCGGTIFADHASGFLSVQHQVTLGGSDTVRSKRSFEQECREYQVSVHEYHGDNGVFKAESFAESLESKGQTIHFSGTGAHHQNAVAERAIRTSTERARTLMVHAAIHWPEQVDDGPSPSTMPFTSTIIRPIGHLDSHLSRSFQERNWIQSYCLTPEPGDVLLMSSIRHCKMARRSPNGSPDRDVANSSGSLRAMLLLSALCAT
jgi:hypothetical protein